MKMGLIIGPGDGVNGGLGVELKWSEFIGGLGVCWNAGRDDVPQPLESEFMGGSW